MNKKEQHKNSEEQLESPKEQIINSQEQLKNSKEQPTKIEEIEIQLINQEHRFLAVLQNLAKYIPENDKRKKWASIKAFIFNVGSRSTMAILFSILGVFFAWKSDKKLETQNLLIKEQSHLSEAQRKSSMIFLMSDIMNKVDEELKIDGNSSRKLSDLLISRIISLSHSLKPYKHLNGDSLSIERGHLLTNLSLSKIHEKSLEQIYLNGNFQYSHLENASLIGAYLNKVDLSYSNLTEAKLKRTSMEGAKLKNCVLDSIFFVDTNLQDATIESDFTRCTFTGTQFQNTNFGRVTFYNCYFNEAFLKRSNFSEVKIRNSEFIKTDLPEAIAYMCPNSRKKPRPTGRLT